MGKETTKNTNFPKFIIRLFQKYGSPSHSLHKGKPENMKLLTKIMREFKDRSTNHFNMNDIERVFGDDEFGGDFCALNRKKIMLHFYTESGRMNSDVTHRKDCICQLAWQPLHTSPHCSPHLPVKK